MFANLEPATTFINQPMVGTAVESTIYKNENLSFNFNNYVAGTNDVYLWMKDESIVDGETKVSFNIENAALADSEANSCTITNSLFPKLTLYSDSLR